MPVTTLAPRTVLFIGSGLSTNLGMPSWIEILNSVANEVMPDKTTWPDSMDAGTIVGQEYAFADFLANLVGRKRVETEIIKILKIAMGNLNQQQVHDFSVIFHALNPDWIITTNWDTNLETLMNIEGLSLNSEDLQESYRQILQRIRENKRFVLHVHGSIDTAPLVITTDDAIERGKAILEYGKQLEMLLATHQPTVIGYSFPDEHIESVMVLATALAGETNPIRLVQRRSRDEDFNRSHPLLAGSLIRLEYVDHDDFLDSLRELSRMLNAPQNLPLIITARNSSEFMKILEPHPYTYEVTLAIRDFIAAREHPEKVYGWCFQYLTETRQEDLSPSTASICAVLLSSSGDDWLPDSKQKLKLQSLVIHALTSNRHELVGAIGPLAVALGKRGDIQPFQEFLTVTGKEPDWRTKDYRANSSYYASDNAAIAAAQRHFNEQDRKDKNVLLITNDIFRILDIIPRADIDVINQVLLPLVIEMIGILYRHDSELSIFATNELKKTLQASRHQVFLKEGRQHG